MESNRRGFIKGAGIAGLALFAGGTETGAEVNEKTSPSTPNDAAAFWTELFLDNDMLEAVPGVSRRLHPAKKHLLNPVIRCDRWCDGEYMQPYTTMYDEEERLFKMWARSGSDSNSGYVGGNAGYMLYFTSPDGLHWEKPVLGVAKACVGRTSEAAHTSRKSSHVPKKLTHRSRARTRMGGAAGAGPPLRIPICTRSTCRSRLR